MRLNNKYCSKNVINFLKATTNGDHAHVNDMVVAFGRVIFILM